MRKNNHRLQAVRRVHCVPQCVFRTPNEPNPPSDRGVDVACARRVWQWAPRFSVTRPAVTSRCSATLRSNGYVTSSSTVSDPTAQRPQAGWGFVGRVHRLIHCGLTPQRRQDGSTGAAERLYDAAEKAPPSARIRHGTAGQGWRHDFSLGSPERVTISRRLV
jgi:hypothetical protein